MARRLENVWKIYDRAKVPFGKANCSSVQEMRLQKCLALVLQTVTVLVYLALPWSACVGKTFLIRVINGFAFAISFFMYLSDFSANSLIETLDLCLTWCEELHSCAADKWRIFEDISRKSEFQFKALICYMTFATCVAANFQMITRSLARGEPSFVLESYFIFFYDETYWGSFLLIISCQVFAVILPLGRNLVTASLLTYLLHFIGVLKVVQLNIQQTFSSETLLQLKGKKTIKELVDLHCDMIRLQNVVIESFKVPLLIFEAECYVLLVTFWAFTVIIPELWVVALAVQGNSFAYITICWYNEKLKEAYDELRETLYGLPWTTMSVKNRKTLLFLMTAIERQKLLSAGSFHIIEFEELKNIFSRVLSYVLLLNQLIKS